jgi:hypothetical protein
MGIRERNLKNILSRWKKQHENELNWIKSHKDTDFLKARLCGYLAGDGSISIRKEKSTNKIHHEIRFYPDNNSLIKPYIIAFKKVYNKTPNVIKLHNHYVIRINSKIVAHDLLSLCSFGLKNWTMPKFNNKKCKAEWLRSMFDSDSYVGKGYIRLKTVNKKGLESVKNLLNELKVETSKIYNYKPKNKKWSINYILDIRNIGFNHKLKKEKLLNLISKSNVPRKLCRDYKISNA